MSDVALAAAFGTAVLLGQRPYSGRCARCCWLNLVYQFATLFTVIVNPYVGEHGRVVPRVAARLGRAHRRVGGRRGRAMRALALSLIVVTACVIAVAHGRSRVIAVRRRRLRAGVLRRGRSAMHKNFVGTVMAFGADRGLRQPRLGAGGPRAGRGSAFWLLLAAIVMTQSRQAIIGLVVADHHRRCFAGGATGRSRCVLLLLIPAAWLIVSDGDRPDRVAERLNSFFQRLDWFREVYALLERVADLRARPALLVQRRRRLPFQPPQAEMEVLASAGVVGLIGFLVMWIGVLVVLWRVDPRFGTLAVAVIAQPHRAGAVRPVLGRRPGVDPVRDRRHLPGGDGA